VSIFVSVKAATAAAAAAALPLRLRCGGAARSRAPREESRATMHADPYSGRCYFRSILSIEEGRRTARAIERANEQRARLRNRALFSTRSH